MPQPKKESAPLYLKVPPHNIEAEQAILGGILLNNEAMNQVIDILSPEDFYREAHISLFEGMSTLYQQGEPIDIITLSQALSRKGVLDRVGGGEYLASLADAVSTSAGIGYHAQIVKDFSVRRKLISQCSTISESCFRDGQHTEDLLEMAEQSIFDIAEEQVKEGFATLNAVIKESFSRLESTADADGYVTGLPTGFANFDRLTAGLQPSDLIIIAGRPSMGKTALALNIAYNAAKKTNRGIAVFSLEMSKQQLGIRLLGLDSQINSTRLRTGRLGEKEWGQLTESANRLSELPVFIDDSSGITALEMKAKCRRLTKSHGLGLVIVDYLQLIQGRRSAESRQLEISEISRLLKALAKDLNVPVLALSQLNRKVEDRPTKKPQLADLRESGALEQDADVIVFIFKGDARSSQDEVWHDNIIDIEIAKQRNGPTGSFKLTFQRELTRFRDYTDEEPPV